jgi:hypothetical protein
VRGGAGCDLNVSVVLQLLEGAEHVLVVTVAEIREIAGVPVMVEAGQGGHLLLTGGFEAGDVGSRPGGSLRGVVDEVLDDQRIAQLLGQNRGDADRQPEPHPLVAQLVERVEHREICFGQRLVNPLFSVRPHPGLPGVGKMGVENKGKSALCRHRKNSFSRWSRRTGKRMIVPVPVLN